MIPWDKNPDYPTMMGNCRECGQWGTVKLAWDHRGFLCIDYKSCLQQLSMIRQRKYRDLVFEDPIVIEPNQDRFERAPRSSILTKHSKVQLFTCENCFKEWERPSTRGRPPKICPECR